jgi:protein gp37
VTVVLVVVLVVVLGGAVIAILGWDRYRGAGQKAGGGAQATDEVFIDPSSGQRMRVWFDPKTGLREYRPDQP